MTGWVLLGAGTLLCVGAWRAGWGARLAGRAAATACGAVAEPPGVRSAVEFTLPLEAGDGAVARALCDALARRGCSQGCVPERGDAVHVRSRDVRYRIEVRAVGGARHVAVVSPEAPVDAGRWGTVCQAVHAGLVRELRATELAWYPARDHTRGRVPSAWAQPVQLRIG
jgi:hypothetical protein